MRDKGEIERGAKQDTDCGCWDPSCRRKLEERPEEGSMRSVGREPSWWGSQPRRTSLRLPIGSGSADKTNGNTGFTGR